MDTPHALSCHCGAIRLEVDAPLANLVECNCSTCRRHGMIHWKVPATSVALLSERCRLSTYAWRAVSEGHHFCSTCGTPIVRTGYPNGVVSVNARCIEGIDVFALEVRRYDGRQLMPPGPLP
jgi:hypothetical protein